MKFGPTLKICPYEPNKLALIGHTSTFARSLIFFQFCPSIYIGMFSCKTHWKKVKIFQQALSLGLKKD